MNRFEHSFKVPVQFVLFFFGLVNAGVPLGSIGTGTWIVVLALLVGKPVGIVLSTVLSIKAGLRAPGGLTTAHTVVVGVAAGIGFTVALFFATAAFPPGPVLDEVKMGALLSFLAPLAPSCSAAPSGFARADPGSLIADRSSRSDPRTTRTATRIPHTAFRYALPMEATDRPVADASWDEHYRDERDAAFLYRELASVEPAVERRELFEKLAAVEDRHALRWEELFRTPAGRCPRTTALRTRALAWMARTFGSALRAADDARRRGARSAGVSRAGARSSSHQLTHKAAVDIASDSAVHARELSEVMGREGEPWHTGGAGGMLRSVVYGFNDGLTANFGLVAGVIGANVAPHIVIISGVAGAIADALSMGSSGYLAAKSEAEVHAHQIEMERHEMRLMPDLEEEELALIYEAKGLPADRARETAHAMMQDPAARPRCDGPRGAEHPSGGAGAAEGRLDHRHRDRRRRVHPDPAVPVDGARRARSGCRWRSACSRISPSAARAACSPAAASGPAAATCSWSDSASPQSATLIGELITRVSVGRPVSQKRSAAYVFFLNDWT